MKPTLFAPLTLTALLAWGCGGNVSAPISQQADSVEDAGALPAPDAHLAFDFDASILSTPVPPGSPDAGATPGSGDAASGSQTDAAAAPPDAAPQGMDATPPQPAPADAIVPPSPPADATVPPPPAADATSSDDAAAYADISVSDDTGPGNSGPPAADSGTMTCLDDGKDCSADSECCTGLCLSFGSCGECIELAGLCLSNSDCCDGHCNLETNACM